MRTARVGALWWSLLLPACSQGSAPATIQPTPTETHQLPTASEVFRLRSECAHLGEKILSENVVGSAMTQAEVSHYNERTNRCYVELTVQTADTTKPLELHRHLFDGQTKELLATTSFKNDSQSGIAFKASGVVGFEQVNAYIDGKMKDESQ